MYLINNDYDQYVVDSLIDWVPIRNIRHKTLIRFFGCTHLQPACGLLLERFDVQLLIPVCVYLT